MALSYIRAGVSLAAFAALTLSMIAGCQMVRSPGAATAPATTAPAPVASVSTKGGAELWAETCSHCHNLRSPSSYGPAQWEVAVYDMRVRAHLTGEEQRLITEFLKAASQ